MVKVILALMVMWLSGCCARPRPPLESCVDGITYLKFPSGVTVKYLADGEIATCK